MDIQQMFCSDDNPNLKFGYLIHGHYHGYDNDELIIIDAVLGYNKDTKQLYFEKYLTSNNIMTFEKPEDAEYYFDTNQDKILVAGSNIFPDAEHTIYNIIDFRPKSEEVRPLTDIICKSSINYTTVYCLCIKLFDNSPKVNNIYFIGFSDLVTNELVVVKQIVNAILFEKKEEANTFYLEHETALKEIAQTYKDKEVFENAGIVIVECNVSFGKETVVGTIPERPIPPRPPHPPIPPFPPRPPFPPHN